DGVYDILAIRIILEMPPDKTEEDKRCWQVYSIVTNLFTPDTNRLRDWITKPKPNGYESLHGTVSDERGRVVEVQIRSRRMDTMAESGMAAHWSYKGIKRNEVMQEWLDRLKCLLQSDLSPDSEIRQFFSQFKINEVFVFTPAGDLRRLPAGATVLDYAFDIHSNLGIRCCGAKIQNRVVSIREKLQTGDVVEVITSKNQRPSADWLNIVTINKAKSKIRQKLREYEGKKELLGRELLERRMKNWKMELNEDIIVTLLRHFKLKNINDLYAALGQDKISIDKIKEWLERPCQEPEYKPREEAPSPSKSSPNSDYLVIDPKLGKLSYKLAKCCNPFQGDEVFGFITTKEGIKLHRKSCPNTRQLYEKYEYRIIPIQWKTQGTPAISGKS
ncbi:MAG: TGS domain-containing protein, partial [Bacteroidales bacterium]|nr:TGS domain-containing protein [Bacteroidales bacterium]